MGTLLVDATLNREFRSAAKLGMVDDNGSVRIFDVLQSAFGKAAVFLKRIMLRNSAQLIKSARRTPTAAIDSMFQSYVERRAIHARLPAGNDFQN